MNASFDEKSVWIQLFSMVAVLGAYLVVAGVKLSNGVTAVVEFVPLFLAAVVLMVAVLATGHIVVAVSSRREGRDERDRLIGWRAESNSSRLLAVGVLSAVTCLVLSIENIWNAHLLLLSHFLSNVTGYIFQLIYYRRGV